MLLRTALDLACAAALCLSAVDVDAVAAQHELSVEFGASRIGPALGADGEHARYVMAGLRGGTHADGGTGLFGSVLFGRTLDATAGGSFLSSMLEATLAERWTPSLVAGLDVRVVGYGAEEPFPYRAFAAEGGPTLRYRTPSVSLALSGLGGVGRSQFELWRVEDGPSRLFENDLWRAGGTAELLFGPATSAVGVAAGWHRTPSGDYRSTGARLLLAGGWGLTELRADWWRTPFSSEVVAGVTVVVPIGASWSLRGFFGRTDPDPLTLAQPGGGSGGVLLARSLLSNAEEVDPWSNLYEVVRYGDEAARVRMIVQPPAGAKSVGLLADFTLWDPVAMTRDGERWVVEMDVPMGIHHFGFLVDDEWYLPDHAPDVVPDEWGRMSATLVIEGAS